MCMFKSLFITIIATFFTHNAQAQSVLPEKPSASYTYQEIITDLHRPEIPTKTTVIYAHGFGGNGLLGHLQYTKGTEHLLGYFYHNQKCNFSTWNFLFDTEKHNIISFNFQDILINLGIYGSIPNPFLTHLAQRDDIDQLLKAINNAANQMVIGFGVSRGAATWITTLGTKQVAKKVGCLVLESPFSSMKNVMLFQVIHFILEAIRPLFPSIDPEHHASMIMKNFFTSYQMDGIQPIDAIENISKDIPILLVHSKEDAIIPINNSRHLYNKLRESGHTKIFLLELDHGKHASLLKGPQGLLYARVVHAFFKHWNIPYDPILAAGINLDEYQPAISMVHKNLQDEAISSKIKQNKSSLFEVCYSFSFDSWL